MYIRLPVWSCQHMAHTAPAASRSEIPTSNTYKHVYKCIYICYVNVFTVKYNSIILSITSEANSCAYKL